MINFYDINVYCYDDSVGTVMAYCTPAVDCDLKKRMNVLITSTRYMYMYVHLLLFAWNRRSAPKFVNDGCTTARSVTEA